jgi:hypothetical protein
VRERYRAAGKREQGRILDEFCRTTGYHRKAAIRLLRRPPRPPGRRSPPRRYGPDVAHALYRVWEVADRICAKRLAPLLLDLAAQLEHHGGLQVAPPVRALLLGLSPATIDRLLRKLRAPGYRQPCTASRSLTAIKAQVPVRTWAEWTGVAPGALQADLVSHCGESTEGFYRTTLVAVDVATGWAEREALWGKGQQRVGTGVHHLCQRLPFPVRELHPDNGSEFLNELLYPWCRREGVRFTRGRPYTKNDQAYAEQKNWAAVWRRVGYERYSPQAALATLQRLYGPLRDYTNFFQPPQKLVGKERVGARVKKRYDRARTPYQRHAGRGGAAGAGPPVPAAEPGPAARPDRRSPGGAVEASGAGSVSVTVPVRRTPCCGNRYR